MAEFKLLMPKMGESVIEATILAWNKKVGDKVNEQEVVLEVATDKVDSEVPSPVNGIIKKLLHDINVAVGVGEPLAIIEIEVDANEVIIEKINEDATLNVEQIPISTIEESKEEIISKTLNRVPEIVEEFKQTSIKTPIVPEHSEKVNNIIPSANKYYSPLVLSIAQVENISMQELESIQGNGMENRVTKEDVLEYVDKKKKGIIISSTSIDNAPKQETIKQVIKTENNSENKPNIQEQNSNVEIIEMDRMRKLISHHMTNSRKTAAHVSSFVECDVTNIVRWREKHKNQFQKRESFGLSFMPIFIDAIAKAIKEYPMINVSVDGDKIIRKKDINIGIATALPNGNLIVPVIRNADQKSLLGIAKSMNDIVVKARTNTLQPDDVMNGTYTISNIGTFGNILGTPIINLPQVAIMAIGSIVKKPVVLEVDNQDVIAIRHMMYLSHTYDHRVVDGQLGGLFVKKVSNFLEKFDMNQDI